MLERELDPQTEERLHQDLARTFSDERLEQIKCKRYLRHSIRLPYLLRVRSSVIRCATLKRELVFIFLSLCRIDSRLVQQRIFNVLKAFCLMYTNITYEQGMSFIAGVLVLLTDEEVSTTNHLSPLNTRANGRGPPSYTTSTTACLLDVCAGDAQVLCRRHV
jgi:hypothetical protein